MIDTHLHLSHQRFAADRGAVLERARTAGVHAAVEVGWDLASSQAAVALAARHPGVLFPTAGIHPHYVAKAPHGAIDALRGLAENGAPLVAIGETGLDFYRDLSPRAVQEDLFRAHIGLALELGLPLVVHSRAATERVLEILTDELLERHHAGGVLHCFSGGQRAAARVADLGFHLGIGGTLTYDDQELAAVVRQAPEWQLVLETDAPYLAPAPHRRERNEPARLTLVRELVAGLRGCTAEEVDAITTENARRLFRLPADAGAPASRVAS